MLPDPLFINRANLADFDVAVVQERGVVMLIDKPVGWTSFDVVAKCRNVFGVRKIGHAGTLDPLATGVLVLCFGRATKQVERLMADTKEYEGRIRLGATTETEDAEGEEREIRSEADIARLATTERINEVTASFLGTSMQTPPMFSARKVKGKRLYKLAREGKVVDRPARPIIIDAISVQEVDLPCLDVRIVCSKGTYIRSIARDFGERIGLGGYLAGLRRTASGPLRVDDALRIEEIIAYADLSQT